MPLYKTYYVNAETGRDSFDGLSEATAFASLRAVNRLTLQPGDRVRLARGSVFAGQYLHLTCCGSKDAPIVVGAYGDGPAPRIDADGQGIWYQDYGCPLDSPTHVYRGYVSSAVLLYDAAYVTVQDLEITNTVVPFWAKVTPSPTRWSAPAWLWWPRTKAHAAALRCAISPSTM